MLSENNKNHNRTSVAAAKYCFKFCKFMLVNVNNLQIRSLFSGTTLCSFALMLLLCGKLTAQVKQARNVSLINAASEFIPSGYLVIDSAFGNLNSDQFTDVILALAATGEDTTAEPHPRICLLLVGSAACHYRLGARNDNIILKYGEGGSFPCAWLTLSIAQGSFSIQQEGGLASAGWDDKVTFKYKPEINDWLLTTIDKNTIPHNDTDPPLTKFSTSKQFGRILFSNYSSYKNY